MKAPISWLRDLVELPAELNTQKLAEEFTKLGLTVERIGETGPGITGPLVVGKVLSISEEPQKNGKTIRYCRVDVGEKYNEPVSGDQPASRGIVCGADNFEVDDLVVVALPGAVLPGDFAISARETYGHLSEGMICAEDELEISDDHDGIMVLSKERKLMPGDDCLSALWNRDEVLELEITPDLGYCLSMRGLAREAAAIAKVPFQDLYAHEPPTDAPEGHPVVLESDRCRSFVALTIEDFDPKAPSPRWLVERLLASGVRSISLPVDVTNYVMLESGQPLHAYDAAKLAGPIRVRLANPDESLKTLDGVERKLDSDDLLIVDDSGPIGLAGVMGGETTEVSEETTAIVLEAAHFEATSVSRTFRRHGLPSEASKRFERTVDPALPYAAARRAAELLVRHGGGSLKAEKTVVGTVPESRRITIRAGLISSVLGTQVEASKSAAILHASGVKVTALGDSLDLILPSWRTDLRDPYDIVEEVGRKFGYDQIGSTIPRPPLGRGLSRIQSARRRALRAAADFGFTEVLTLPFVSEEDQHRMGLNGDESWLRLVRLANPLSDEQPFLRNSLLPGLFAAVAKNTSRSLDDLALFEHGTTFLAREQAVAPCPSVTERPSPEEIVALDAALPSQPEMLAAVVCGNWQPASWTGTAEPADWRHVVALAERMAASVGARLERKQTESAPWHPGRCTELWIAGTPIGFAGELHPNVITAFGLPTRTCAVEFNLGKLLELAPTQWRIGRLASHPLAKEDVALIVSEEVAAAAVEEALVEGAGELLESIQLFDVYQGPQVGEGNKSLAFALRFRADRTLTDAEAAEARQCAVEVAVKRFGAQQRA